jgi:hypothetical protein
MGQLSGIDRLEADMWRSILIPVAAFWMLGSCNDTRRADSANFTTAINQYLAKHGQACTFFAQTFPIEVPASELKDQSGTPTQVAVLERAAGARQRYDSRPPRHDGALGPSAPRPARRYELTDEGRKYLQMKPGILGQSSALCYGHEAVDSIVGWTKPASMGSVPQTEATYTYKMPDLAPWAKRADVQQAFGDIRTTVNGVSKFHESVSLQLTNQGWEVAGQ